MRRLSLSLLLLLATTALAATETAKSYKLIAVEDGDTLIVQIGTQEKRLQLSGIDAPEDVTNPKLVKDLGRTGLSEETLLMLGKQATDYLKQLVLPGAKLRITGNLDSSDKYGRIPVVIYSDNHSSLNERMVADGYAVVMSKAILEPSLKQQLLQSQQQAQNSRWGLWGQHRQPALLWSGQATNQ
ncbi:MAG: thermonuclease family protein [Sedimenticola sp.]|nr:thermonuclease family protein [Sedimenticola sp.]